MNGMKRLTLMLLVCALALACCACSEKKAKELNLSQTLAQITQGIALPEGAMDLTLDALSALYGITSSEISQFAGYVTGVGTLADEIVLLEASGGKSIDALKAKVDARVEAKMAEMKDYLPDEYVKVTQRELVVSGNYIALFVSGDASALKAAFEGALK